MRMQWIVDHWFEITTTILLAVIAINTFDGKMEQCHHRRTAERPHWVLFIAG